MTPEEIKTLVSTTTVSGVSLAPGTENGTLKLTVSGTTYDNIKVKGLSSAAYKAVGSGNGQVPLNGSNLGNVLNVPVVTDRSGHLIPHASGPLGSSAFQDTTAFATAEQGIKADTAIQRVSISTGSVNGEIILNVDGKSTAAAVRGLGSAAFTASNAYATAAQGIKADNAMPKSGGSFTGAVSLFADPTTALQPATKQYVDGLIRSSIAASDAMVFKGTIGTNGTATTLPTSNVVVGDTYKVISPITIPAANSYTKAAVSAKTGDLIVAMSKTEWLLVPSGDETVTTVKYSATSTNLTTNAQSGSITLGYAAAKQVDTAISNSSTSANLPTSSAVAKFVEGKGYVTENNKVKNTPSTTTKFYLTGTASSTENTGTQYFDTGVYVDNTAGKLVATTFVGNLTGNVSGSSGSCTGNAATATRLQTARTIALSGGVTATATSFNGTQNITIPVTQVNTDFLVNGTNVLIFNGGAA